jgi:hypothetical protein
MRTRHLDRPQVKATVIRGNTPSLGVENSTITSEINGARITAKKSPAPTLTLRSWFPQLIDLIAGMVEETEENWRECAQDH